MLHCDGKFGVGKSEILGTTASTTCSDGKVGYGGVWWEGNDVEDLLGIFGYPGA